VNRDNFICRYINILLRCAILIFRFFSKTREMNIHQVVYGHLEHKTPTNVLVCLSRLRLILAKLVSVKCRNPRFNKPGTVQHAFQYTQRKKNAIIILNLVHKYRSVVWLQNLKGYARVYNRYCLFYIRNQTCKVLVTSDGQELLPWPELWVPEYTLLNWRRRWQWLYPIGRHKFKGLIILQYGRAPRLDECVRTKIIIVRMS